MFHQNSALKLTDMIDVEFLQNFQDRYAKAINIASIIVDDDGPITEPSNFTDFCYKYTRNSKLGYERCNMCDIEMGKAAAEKKEPVIYTCHTGLTDFAVPIIVNGRHIASILGGQILSDPPDEEHFRKVARELGIPEDEYIEAVKKLNIIPIESVESFAQFLFIAGNVLSEIAHKNYMLKRINARDQLYRDITEKIRLTLNVDETKREIVNILGKTLNADRCFLIEYDKDNDTFSPVHGEYRSSDKIKSYDGIDLKEEIPTMIEEFKLGKTLVFNEGTIKVDSELVDMNHEKFAKENEATKNYNITSAFIYPITYLNEYLGSLVIHYVNQNYELTKNEIDIVNLVGGQIAVALHQAKLFEETKKLAEREKFNRKIVEILRSTFDKTLIKSLFVKSIGKYYNADRVLYSDYDENKKMFLPTEPYAEYLSSPDVKSFIGYDWSQEEARDYIEPLLAKRELNILNLYTYIEENHPSQSFINLFIDAGVKSSYNFPVLFQQHVLGYFCIEFTQKFNVFDTESINGLRNICTQAGIAIFQSELYEKAQKANAISKEIITNLLKNIDTPLENIFNSLDSINHSDFSPQVLDELISKLNDNATEIQITVNQIKKNFENY